MTSTRIFICHNLDLAEEAQLEVQILNHLCQKLQRANADVVIYPGLASAEDFLSFFYQKLPTCQWFLLFQTESAVQSFDVRSAVIVAKMRVEQKQMQGILRFIALPDELSDLPAAWLTIPALGGTWVYQQALEKLLLVLSLGHEAKAQKKSPVHSAPLTPRPMLGEAPAASSVQRSLKELSLAPSPQPVADLKIAPGPVLPVDEYTRINSSADTLLVMPMHEYDRPAKPPSRRAKRHLWFSALLVSILIMGIFLFTVVLPLRASKTHISGTPLVAATVTAVVPGTIPPTEATAPALSTSSTQGGTAIVIAAGTASAAATGTTTARGTATAQGTVSAEGTATAVAQATASTPQGLYAATTKKAPDMTDALAGPSSLKWDLLAYGGGGGCSYTGGTYRAAMAQSGFFATCMAEASSYRNFLYQVSMTMLSGSTSSKDGGGLIFRGATGTAYRLRIGINGSYDLVTPAKTLATGTSTAIKTGVGQTNLVAVAASGNTIDIYVNGQLLATLTDTTSSVGQIGLMAVDFSTTGVNVSYRNAQIWLL